MGGSQSVFGSFSEPMDNLVSYLAAQSYRNAEQERREYPWRRLAYDRTLSCPDLARAINDFLSDGVEFVSNDDRSLQLCA